MPTPAARPVARWLIAAVALVAAVAGWWFWGQTAAAGTPPPNQPLNQPLNQPSAAVTSSTSPSAAASAGEVAAEPMPITTTERTAPPRDSELAQGLRGLVVDESGRALANVPVHLVESASNDPLLLPLIQQQQHFLAPVASTLSADDGTFALGLEVVQDKVYEVYVASPHHAVTRLGGLRLLAENWHDLGAITLERGAVLRGRVTVEGQPGIPVPQAVVSLETGGAFADAALRALPFGQGALVGHVDHAGFYELPRAPRHGIVQLIAAAPGFARQVRRDIDLSTPGVVEIDFALPPANSVAGSVRDQQGAAIASARVEAWPRNRREEPLVALSDEQGNFVVHGLRSPDYWLRVTANGFATTQLDSLSFDRECAVTMQALGRLRVVARTENGEVLRRYRLAVRRFFPGDRSGASLAADATPAASGSALPPGSLGPLPEVREQVVRLGNDEQFATIDGVPAGTLVCEVLADGFARSWSQPIDTTTLLADTTQVDSPLQITVIVTHGSELRGRVLDVDGRPLAEAVVRTQPAGTAPDNPLFRVLRGTVPTRTTERVATTDRDGWFRMDNLSLAVYQLELTHPAACRTFVRDLDLTAPGARTIPPTTMLAGALVHGTATVAGRLAGQIKVVLITPTGTAASEALRLETITDADGRFAFDRRVPPGAYELRGAVVGSRDADAEAFHLLLQLQRSSTPVAILAGQAEVERDLDLPPLN